MCYDSKARPPFPAERRGTAQGKDLVLTADDGNQFAAFVALPENPLGATLVILPDVRGLHQFYKDLALLFAEAGVSTIVWDYFGRTAGLGARDDSFEFWPHVQQTTPDTFAADLRAAVASGRAEFGAQPVFTLGFCMGGSLSLKAGTMDLGLSGVVGFYSGLSRTFGALEPSVLEFADSIRVPVLDLFGGADQGITATEVAALEEKLSDAGLEHEIVTYEGAPHSFFDRRWADFADASADAWSRVLTFIAAHTGSAS